MAVETVFLTVLVVALIAGHFFLEITKTKKQEAVSSETQKLLMPSDTLSNPELSTIIERLDRLEKLLLSPQAEENFSLQGSRIQNGLQKKLQSLVDFKHEIRIEVAALKEELKEIKEFVGMKEEQREEIPEISAERLRELVYNVRK